ncbi:MAG: DUF1998 domain-containing protein [Candidatus Omnitrophota bacterium]
MTKGPIRRAQLIAPFGVGAMVIVKDGTSLITAGLDHWYQHEPNYEDEVVDRNEYIINEWRLQRLLRVNHFRNPPDFRTRKGFGKKGKNQYLTVPFLRFPQWHFCLACNRLEQISLHQREKGRCRHCAAQNNRAGYLVQVPIVAMCSAGHIQDFPWREWVHRSAYPACNLSLRLVATGSTSLAAQVVWCECGANRNLGRIMESNADDDGNERSYLSAHLFEEEGLYPCQGKRPWLGGSDISTCSHPLRGSLRNASNVYFAHIRSAIYLPRRRGVSETLLTLLEKPPLSEILNILLTSGAETEVIVPSLKRANMGALDPFSDEELKAAIDASRQPERMEQQAAIVVDDDEETAFRRSEYEVLSNPRDEEVLKIRKMQVNLYGDLMKRYFESIMLVDKLRETRVLAGFSRIFAENEQTLEQQRSLLWRDPENEANNWLPGYKVFGEGIFFRFKEDVLRQWESLPLVASRIEGLARMYARLQHERGWRPRTISPRYVLIHTFSHCLINRLTFDSGYSTASLREKLYVSSNHDVPMAGLLIYTAAGDAEGSMGGLVKMGEVDNLENVVVRALNDAKWCSSDPVCMEMGEAGGQGPFSCNLAACHGCCLVPETACEEFNKFLDRAMLIGSFGAESLGFFNEQQIL